MTYEQFEKLIITIEKVRERSSAIYDWGLDIINFEDDYFNIVNILMDCVFDQEGHDWIDWYLYERIGFNGKTNLATDKDGNEICYDIPSLWETVKEHLK
jgi:hypothetical protein